MKAVFADTFYFLALVNPKDQAHRKALDFSAGFDGSIVTSTWILMEVGDALCRVPDRATFLKLLDNLANDSSTGVVPATQDVFEKAKILFAARPDKDWSMTDCTSFVIMQEGGMTDAITGDKHFVQAGFRVLLRDGA
jgi:predicted nucleic acid-binding protein